MAGPDEGGEVSRRGRPEVPAREAEVEVGGKVVAGGVAPLAIDEAVGRRQQLERVDAEVLEVGTPPLEGRDAGELCRLDVGLDQRPRIAERADPDLCAAFELLGPDPGRGQLVDDEAVVRWQLANVGVAGPVGRLAAWVAGHQTAVLEHQDASRVAVVLAESRVVRRIRQQSFEAPIDGPSGRVGAPDHRMRGLARVAVLDRKPVVVDLPIGEVAIGCGDLPQIRRGRRRPQLELALVNKRGRVAVPEPADGELWRRVRVAWTPKDKVRSFTFEQIGCHVSSIVEHWRCKPYVSSVWGARFSRKRRLGIVRAIGPRQPFRPLPSWVWALNNDLLGIDQAGRDLPRQQPARSEPVLSSDLDRALDHPNQVVVHALQPLTRQLAETETIRRHPTRKVTTPVPVEEGVGGGALPMSAGTSPRGRRKPNGSACQRRTMAGVQDEAKHAISAMSPLKSCAVEKPQPQR